MLNKKQISLVVFFFLSAVLHGQVAGRLSGTVTDSSGAVVAGAKVSLYFDGGSTALAVTTTSSEGGFAFSALSANTYDLSVEQTGFLKYHLRGVKVDPGKDTPLTAIRLDVSTVSESVDVSANAETVQTTNAEVSTTVTNEQIRKLPLINRSFTNLLLNQPGVSNGRGYVVVNGMRSSYTNMTYEGVNIQDNYLRGNNLTYQPNLLNIDQIGEFTVGTSNMNAGSPAGSSQVILTAPSGTNQLHGAVYWYNRNNATAAKDWFDNRNGIDKARLNQNQLGFKLGGPVKKDKLFFYVNYEAYRNRQQTALQRTILTDSGRRGDFIYRDSAGNTRSVNLLGLRNVTIDPVIQALIDKLPAASQANNFDSGDSRPGFSRNTAGYAFQARSNRDRNNVVAKTDYIFSQKHSFAGTYSYSDDSLDRPTITANSFATVPDVQNQVHAHLLSGVWRWNPKPTVVNELRGGFNLAPGSFANTAAPPPFYVAGLSFSNPVNEIRDQGRATDTYNISNITSWYRGRHNMSFGYQQQNIRTAPYDFFSTIPTYTLAMGAGQQALTAAELPGVSALDLASANNLLASLGGFIDSYTQRFNVKDRTSGFVPGQKQQQHLALDNYAFFVQDQWKVNRRLMMTLGLRWDYQTPLRSTDGLYLSPKLTGNYIQTILSNATLDFAGGPGLAPLYKKDRNNFAPNIGLAWDVFGNGKTALRGGYSIHFVNDSTIPAVDNTVITNRGLNADVSRTGLGGRLSAGRPAVPTPVLKVPRTFQDNFDLAPDSNAQGIANPDLVTPYVQQWNFGIQQEIKGTILEVRYVGNHSTKQFRAFDFNQVNVKAGGFLDDFIRARNNGFLSLNSTGRFDPRFNSAIAGSQRTPVFDSIEAGGLLTNGTVAGAIQRGEAAALANLYVSSGFEIPFNFYNNPTTYGANVMMNYSNTNYNSLQVEARRRLAKGLMFQANYTWSKVLSDALGDSNILFEPFLDFGNKSAERALAPFDLRHNFKANFIYDLPLGKGHQLASSPIASKVFGGWSVSGLMGWQSGTPFSVLSARGTINRTGTRSNGNTADTTLKGDQLDDVVGFFMTGNGPFFISRSAVGSDGRGVGTDGRAPFSGQAFFNPGPGAIGSLQRRMFSGPTVFSFDMGVLKTFSIRERHKVEFRMEAENIFNHPTFYIGDESASTTRFNINNTTFGVINSTFTNPRLIQFGLYYRF